MCVWFKSDAAIVARGPTTSSPPISIILTIIIIISIISIIIIIVCLAVPVIAIQCLLPAASSPGTDIINSRLNTFLCLSITPVCPPCRARSRRRHPVSLYSGLGAASQANVVARGGTGARLARSHTAPAPFAAAVSTPTSLARAQHKNEVESPGILVLLRATRSLSLSLSLCLCRFPR